MKVGDKVRIVNDPLFKGVTAYITDIVSNTLYLKGGIVTQAHNVELVSIKTFTTISSGIGCPCGTNYYFPTPDDDMHNEFWEQFTGKRIHVTVEVLE